MSAHRKQLSKSAPAGRRHGEKETDKKVITIREINSWINMGNNDPGKRRMARNTGLLTENVTEERLLLARQMELGRERYKFLNQYAYERNKFIERQRKKYAAFKKMRHPSTAPSPVDIQKLESAGRAIGSGLPELPDLEGTGELPDRETPDIFCDTIQRHNAMGRPRYHSEKAGMVSGALSKHKDVHFPKTVKINTCQQRPRLLDRGVSLNSSSEMIDNLANGIKEKPEMTTVEKLPNVKTDSRRCGHFLTVQSATSKTAETLGSNRRLSLMHTAFCAPGTPVDEPDGKERRDSTVNTWARKVDASNLRYGQKFASSIHDPRYVALKHSLAPSVEPAINLPDVRDIIENNDILKKGSRRMHEVNEKLIQQQKFLAYILENEFAIK